ncbi:hypothetical protein HDK64DRAFT_32972 [Phyllosticta capitalensis]
MRCYLGEREHPPHSRGRRMDRTFNVHRLTPIAVTNTTPSTNRPSCSAALSWLSLSLSRSRASFPISSFNHGRYISRRKDAAMSKFRQLHQHCMQFINDERRKGPIANMIERRPPSAVASTCVAMSTRQPTNQPSNRPSSHQARQHACLPACLPACLVRVLSAQNVEGRERENPAPQSLSRSSHSHIPRTSPLRRANPHTEPHLACLHTTPPHHNRPTPDCSHNGILAQPPLLYSQHTHPFPFPFTWVLYPFPPPIQKERETEAPPPPRADRARQRIDAAWRQRRYTSDLRCAESTIQHPEQRLS